MSRSSLQHRRIRTVTVPQSIALFLLLALSAVRSSADVPLQQCVKFLAPPPKAVITTPACTLGVDTSCMPIARTDIMVRYFPAGSDTAIVQTIALLQKPPFRFVWDLSGVPNQLAHGIGIMIEVTFANGDAYGMRREGIFLAHNKRPDMPALDSIPYVFPGAEPPPLRDVAIPTHDPSCSASARLYWNEKGIVVRVNVTDPSFEASAPDSLMERMGIEILLDPAMKRRQAYPTDEAMIFSAPLAGKTSRMSFQPKFNADGTFQLNLVKTDSKFDHIIEKRDRQGFTVTCTVPAFLLGHTVPRAAWLNLVVRMENSAGTITASSLIDESGYNNYSTLRWPPLLTQPQPIWEVKWIIWLPPSSSAWSRPSLFTLPLCRLQRVRPTPYANRRPEKERQAFARIKETIDRAILNRETTVKDLATDLAMSPSQFKRTVKRVSVCPIRPMPIISVSKSSASGCAHSTQPKRLLPQPPDSKTSGRCGDNSSASTAFHLRTSGRRSGLNRNKASASGVLKFSITVSPAVQPA